MRVCPVCRPEWEAWLCAPPLHSETRTHSLIDSPGEMAQINHAHYAARIRAQLDLIERHCRRDHQTKGT